ncbi:protein kinase [Streptomyces sp. NPDC053367]|uniref:serine/threonine-protein kinase n=1 Tax=Streptomyces sp. NPDC053367 TaxID=3365700 RepID=UPI0037D09975
MLVAGRYVLETPLGRGAMGEVWRATDQTLNRPVALKLLTGEAAEKDTARFHLEAQTAARLNHPHVVGVYDFGSHAGQPYLVMELVEGWSLAQERSLRGTLPPGEAARIVGQLANGLAAAHRQGVIHRDIKPANVMLTADGVAKITDFGIARFADAAAGALTATGTVVGSAAYLAPERALGRPAEPACDVYAMGCLLYELLTGRPPFTGATSLAVVQQQVDAAPVPPARLRPDIPQPLSEFVLRLLEKDPARRPTAGEAATWLTALPAAPHRTAEEHAYPAAAQGQGYTGGVRGRGVAAPSPERGFAAAPPERGFAAAPPEQGFAAAPPEQGYAAARQARGFGGTPPAHTLPAAASAHTLPAASPEPASGAVPPVPSPGDRSARPAGGRRRPARPRAGLSPKVLFAVGGVLVFGASAALGASLSSGDSDDASPAGPSASSSPSSPDRPAAETPEPTPTASVVMSDEKDTEDGKEDGKKHKKSEEEDREDD